MDSTPFLDFWAALNAHLRRQGLPEIRYGAARGLWSYVIREAEADATVEALEAVRS